MLIADPLATDREFQHGTPPRRRLNAAPGLRRGV
jgi:hypothetical protein